MGTYAPHLLSLDAFTPPERPEFWTFYARLENFLRQHVDPDRIDETGEYPSEVILGLTELGAFGMKIPREYGGLGLSHPEYVRAMTLLGSYDANVTALLSAHQAIGVPQPLLLFGTEEQREAYLPRCADGAISAFALTEPAVGSDPARLATTGRRSDDGEHFILDGAKLWCTNGTLAELIVVMARDPETDRINAFVLDMSTPGVRVTHRCRFMGLRALANAYIDLDGARVPRSCLIGEEGDGLKIALVTLNTGRLSLPAATAGVAKRCTEIVRQWSSAREQWGQPIGKHEAVAHMNATIASHAFAMEAIAHTVGDLADRDEMDIRLEAAAGKEWNTVACWNLIDDTLQVRGGRGYETARSLANRGEAPIGVERYMRDARINLIFEGSSEIMHLFIAREALDQHLEVAGSFVDPESSWRAKITALPRILVFYALWYGRQWIDWGRWPRYAHYGKLGRHLRFAHRATSRLARNLFYGMTVYRGGLEKKQAFVFRAVDVAMEIFALTATVLRAHATSRSRAEEADSAVALADTFARACRRRIQALLRAFWRNDDAALYRTGRALLDGELSWLERGIVPSEHTAEDLVPASMDELRRERESGEHPKATTDERAAG